MIITMDIPCAIWKTRTPDATGRFFAWDGI